MAGCVAEKFDCRDGMVLLYGLVSLVPLLAMAWLLDFQALLGYLVRDS